MNYTQHKEDSMKRLYTVPEAPRHIEGKTFWTWLACHAITVTDVGEENMYAEDELGFQYYTKHEC